MKLRPGTYEGAEASIHMLHGALFSTSRRDEATAGRFCGRLLPVASIYAKKLHGSLQTKAAEARAHCAWLARDDAGAKRGLEDMLSLCRGVACVPYLKRAVELSRRWLWSGGLSSIVATQLAQLRQEQPTGKRKRFLDALAKANESLVAVDDLRKRVIYSLGDKTPKGGVVIVGLEPMGAAGRAGLHLGDILLGLGGRNLRDIADFSARAEALAAGTGRKKAPDGSVSIYYLRYGLGHEALMPRGKMGCEVVRLPRRFLENR